VDRLVKTQLECNVSREDVVALGFGGEGVVKPYGLGAETLEVKEVEKKENPGALGELGFLGLVPARPGAVGDAYLQPWKWVERREREIKEYEEWYDDEYYDEEYGEEYEEGHEEDPEDPEASDEVQDDGEAMDVD
jgi:hypothetical protein